MQRKSKPMHIYVSDDLRAAIEAEAVRQRRSVSQLVALTMESYLEQRKAMDEARAKEEDAAA